MQKLIRVDRTVVLSREYLVDCKQALSDLQIQAVARTLGTADVEYMNVLSDTANIGFPLTASVDNEPVAATVTVGTKTVIVLDNDIIETLEVQPSSSEPAIHDLDGQLDCITAAKAVPLRSIKLYVPELFRNPEFLIWLESSRVMTWHQRGSGFPDEGDYSDVAIFIDPSLNGEGSDSDMPGHGLVVDQVKKVFGAGPFTGHHFNVVLSNEPA